MYTNITRFRNTVLLLLLFLFSGTKQLEAQTFGAGEIAFTGYNDNTASNAAQFSFVILRTGGINAGTTINFTDNGWNPVTGAIGGASGDGTFTWTAPAGGLAQFTQVTISTDAAGTTGSASTGSVGTITGTFLLAGSGDQILAYQGSPTTFIAAIHMNKEAAFGTSAASSLTNWDDIQASGGWTFNANRSSLPPGITNGVNGVMVVGGASAPYTEYTNAVYNCTGSSGAASVAALAASINNRANWTMQLTSVTIPPVCSFSIGTPPAITGQPSNATVCAGANTSFGITASNATTYQWEVSTNGGSSFTPISNGGVYSNATTTTLNITGATAGMNNYQYHCIATGSIAPAATSNDVTLTVNVAPSITGQPSNATVCSGANTTFSVTASNATGYQWQVNTGSGFSNVSGAPYSGGATATLTITGATTGMNGYTYQCIVSGSCTPNATTNTVTLTVNSAPSVTGQPSNSTICAGSNTSFSVTASNATGYQWQVNTGSGFTNLSNTGVYTGATSATLNITGATAGMNTYSYQCIVSGSCTPTATSNTATLTVNSAPSISGQPSNATICANGNTAFSVTASNATGYQWQVNTGSGFTSLSNTGVYTGATSATLTITGATGSMNGYTYQCIISGACTPNATTNTVTLTVNTSNTWTGAINSAWSLSSNWACGTAPTATTDVVIPSGVTFNPLVNITSAICNNLTINSGGTLSFSGSANILTVKGNLVNNGTFTPSSGKVVLSGSSQNIPAASYKDLQINGAGTKTLTGAASVSGTLTLTNGHLQIGSNNLTVGSAGTISGNTASSFIITNGTGNLVVQNIGSTGKTGAIVFPVGSNSGSFTPVTLTNAGTTDNFSVRAFDHLYGTYNNDVPSSGSQAIDAVDKTWIVGEATAGGSNVTLSLQWNGIDELPGFDENNCYLVHYSNSSNTWALGTMGVASGADPFTMSMSGITSFSPFGVGSIGSPLDVELISFTFAGRSNGDHNQLQWVTASERSMVQYEVERSADGILFDAIGSVKAANNNGTHTYNYTDGDVQTKRTYYRLKMDAADGTFRYSNVISVDRNQAGTISYQVYPNPLDGDNLFIKTDGDLYGTQVQVMDMQGHILISQTPENWQGKTASLNVKQLPAGIYILRLCDSNGQPANTIRFTKK